jgi:two-component system sensor histidine kinase DesK
MRTSDFNVSVMVTSQARTHPGDGRPGWWRSQPDAGDGPAHRPGRGIMGVMRLTSRMGRPPPAAADPAIAVAPPAAAPPVDDLQARVASSLQHRRQALRLVVLVFLVLPAAALLATQGMSGRGFFLIPATAVFLVLIDRVALVRFPEPVRRTWWSSLLLVAGVVLAAGLFAVGHMSWMTPFAVATAAVGRFSPSGRVAMLRVAGCAALGAGIAMSQQLAAANVITAAAVPALAGLLAHNGERRTVLIHRLNETRAELARMAVAEERLRIARDLHDLLGHSLSLIALKAELAGRLMEPDPARAAREIADLETVARRSLSEVRQAVTSYRQPGLAAELAAARRMLASAGVDCRVDEPGGYSLPPAVAALLAWTVREGTTNIVRHAGARRADIRIEITGTLVRAGLADDGAGAGAACDRPAAAAAAAPAAAALPGGTPVPGGRDSAVAAAACPGPVPGSGLAGLAERAARLGGTMQAGPGAQGGFRLQVSVPLTGPGPGGHDQGEIPVLSEEELS